MTLKELKDIINALYNDSNKDNRVYISLKEESIGPVATTEVKSICPGFDWNHGKILIETEDDVKLAK